MLSKLNFFEIRKDAISAIKVDTKIYSFYLTYYIVPFILAFTIHWIKYDIDTSLFSNLLSGISLFAGLLFSIIFVVSNNFNNRKFELDNKEEENQRFLNNYRAFASNIIALISYTVVKSIMIIVILIFSDAIYSYNGDKANLLLRIIWDVLIILLYHFLFYITMILKEMYTMQYEDINRKKH